MLKLRLTILVLVSLLAVASHVLSAEKTAVPKAVFSQTVFEFDAVAEGTEVKHDFMLQNKGDAPLKIENVRTG